MIFREIEFASNDFRKELALRQEILRAPLGLNLLDENPHDEIDHKHFGLFDSDGNLIACVVAILLTPDQAKFRQMAVNQAYQGKGYGRKLIERLEFHLAEIGINHLSMHARLTAVGFYQKLGYTPIGDEFVEVGIPHVRMEKRFSFESVPQKAP